MEETPMSSKMPSAYSPPPQASSTAPLIWE